LLAGRGEKIPAKRDVLGAGKVVCSAVDNHQRAMFIGRTKGKQWRLYSGEDRVGAEVNLWLVQKKGRDRINQ